MFCDNSGIACQEHEDLTPSDRFFTLKCGLFSLTFIIKQPVPMFLKNKYNYLIMNSMI